MKRFNLCIAIFGFLLCMIGTSEASSLSYSFTLGAGETFRGTSRTLDLGSGRTVTVSATWYSANLGASGDGDIWQTSSGFGVFHTYNNGDDPNIDGLGPDETLWLTFNQQVTLTDIAFNFAHSTDQFDFFVGDTLVLSNQETQPGPWRSLGTDGYTGTVFGIRANDHTDDFYVAAIQYNPVPEPGTLILVGSGLLGIVGLGRRKRRA